MRFVPVVSASGLARSWSKKKESWKDSRSEERHRRKAPTLEQPIDKGGCDGLRIVFKDVGTMNSQSDSLVVDKNAIANGSRDWTCL